MIQLTNRQHEVLQLISKGFTSDQIAKQLGIAHGTVEVHRKSLLNKFDAVNAASLIRQAFEKGHFNLPIDKEQLRGNY